MKIKTILYMLLIISYISCKDSNIINPPKQFNTHATENHLFTESIFNKIELIIMQAFVDNDIVKNNILYTFIDNDPTNSDTLIIDFGNGIPSASISMGSQITGKLIIDYTGNYLETNFRGNISFDDYKINQTGIQGEMTIENLGSNFYRIDVLNGLISTNEGTINWNSNKTKEWTEGFSTPNNIYDDKYFLTGKSDGNATNNTAFSAIISSPLNISVSCITSSACIIINGETAIKPENYSERSVVYNNEEIGNCDCEVNVSNENNSLSLIIEN